MTGSPASGRAEVEASLRAIGGQEDARIDLCEAALHFAALDRPRVPLDRYRHHLSLLARDTADVCAKIDGAEALDARVEALNRVIVERYGYAGDRQTYDDLQNVNLMRVIDRRKGMPIALGLLYIHAARAQGWAIEGLNFPAHFLLRLDLRGERVILDPFDGGRRLAPHELRTMLRSIGGEEATLRLEHTRPLANREILLRLQNNIKVRQVQARRLEAALAALESMLMVAPDTSALWREAATVHAHLGNLRAASLALENVLALSPSAHERHEAASALQKIRNRLN